MYYPINYDSIYNNENECDDFASKLIILEMVIWHMTKAPTISQKQC